MNRLTVRVFVYTACLLAIPSAGYADIGLPMLFYVLPASWVLLPLVIVVEAVIAVRLLRTGWKMALCVAAAANLLSTLLGVPLTWVVLVVPEALLFDGAAGLDTFWQRLYAVTVQAPWLIPYESDLYWLVPAAAMSLCVPFFLISVWIERLVALRMLPDQQPADVRRWAWAANGATYGVIILALAVTLAMALKG